MGGVKKYLFASILVILAVAFVGIGLHSQESKTAILVTKKTYADAIVARIISDMYNISMFYTSPDDISPELLQQLKSNGYTTIILIGGPVVLSQQLEYDLKAQGFNVIRIWGVTRYETSAKVAMYFFNQSKYAVLVTRDLVNEELKGSKTELLLAAVNFAKVNGYPLLITPSGTLAQSVADALVALNVSGVYIFTTDRNSLGNITNELSSLNISYEVYTEANVSQVWNVVEYDCKMKGYPVKNISVYEGDDWKEFYPFIITRACVKIEPTKTYKNISKEVEEEENETINEELMKGSRVDLEKIFNKTLTRLVATINRTCEFIQRKCPELMYRPPEEYNGTYIQNVCNIINNLCNISSAFQSLNIIDDEDSLEYLNWKIRNMTGELVIKFNKDKVEEFIKKIKDSEFRISKVKGQMTSFSIVNARKKSSGSIDVTIYNSGDVALDLSQAQCLLEEYDIYKGRLVNTYSATCPNVIIAPDSQSTVSISFSGVTYDFTKYSYKLRINYRGAYSFKSIIG